MLTENASLQQAEAGFASISSIKQQMLEALQSSKEYRHGFIEESIRSRLIAQINSLRKEQGWDLKIFSEKLGKKLSWAYRLEDPNAPIPTIPTLLEVAEALDIGLDVRFRRFSELWYDAVHLTSESFSVPSFEAELKAGAFSGTRRKRPHRRNRSRLEQNVIPFQKRPKWRRVGSEVIPETLKEGQYGIGNQKIS